MPLKPLLALKNKKILVLTHRGADVDAIASASIARLLLQKDNYVEIAVPEHLNKAAMRLAETMEIPFTMQPDFSGFETLVIVDLNSFQMLGNLSEKTEQFKGPIFLFDHHSKAEKQIVPEEFRVINENAASTTEMLWDFIKKNCPEKIDSRIATLCICGLISDSAHFSFASQNTFRVMAEALESSEKNIHQITDLFSVKHPSGERIALLKAAQRSRIFSLNKNIVVLSEIGAFESQSASALLHLGADAAFVGTFEKGSVRISGRAGFSFAEIFELDLSRDIFQRLPDFFEGEGGGHKTAAAFSGKAENTEKVLEKCLSLLTEKIKEKHSNAKIKEH